MVPAVIAQMTVPAIYNGDVFYHDDIARMKKDTGASSAMIARGGTFILTFSFTSASVNIITIAWYDGDSSMECISVSFRRYVTCL
jgi:hypothetical protein